MPPDPLSACSPPEAKLTQPKALKHVTYFTPGLWHVRIASIDLGLESTQSGALMSMVTCDVLGALNTFAPAPQRAAHVWSMRHHAAVWAAFVRAAAPLDSAAFLAHPGEAIKALVGTEQWLAVQHRYLPRAGRTFAMHTWLGSRGEP